MKPKPIPDFAEAWACFIMEDGTLKRPVPFMATGPLFGKMSNDLPGFELELPAATPWGDLCCVTTFFPMPPDEAEAIRRLDDYPVKWGDMICITKQIDTVTDTPSGKAFGRFECEVVT